MKLWGKLWKNNHMLRDHVIVDERQETRTHKIFDGLDEFCREFDLSRPIWLETTIREFTRRSKARFYQDSFIDEIDFDYFELQVLEED